MQASLENAAPPAPSGEIIALDDQPAAISLSVQLRDATRTLHQQVERALGLPAAIESLADYRRVLARYYGFYEPFEHALARFTEWQAIGVDLNDCCQAGRLTSDLQALGEAPERAVRAAKESLPSLPHFASALGALYVVEGSTLGSQFIVRYLTQLLGAQIQGADRFFHGRGSLTYEHWAGFARGSTSTAATIPPKHR